MISNHFCVSLIQAYKKAGYSQKDIASEIGVNPGTVSRELKRNSSSQTRSYSAINAHKVSSARRRYASKKSNLKINTKLKNIIRRYIKEDWSPEQISKRLKAVGITNISYVRIYQFIEQDKQQGGNFIPILDFIIQDTEGLNMAVKIRVELKIESLYLKEIK